MKHLQKLGYVAIGSMLTVAIMGTALAASGAMTITVDHVNVQVNGATFAPKDAQGNSVPVFSYNGTTYAPLRALAEAYGLEVGYDSKNNMATVGAAGGSQTGGQSGAQETPAPTTTPTDPNRVPDITVDELKALFEFNFSTTIGEVDVSYWHYCGSKTLNEFIEYWKTLNQDDVKAALTSWIESYYKTEYSGNRAIRFELSGNKDGTTIRFARLSFAPDTGIDKFYFGWWG